MELGSKFDCENRYVIEILVIVLFYYCNIYCSHFLFYVISYDVVKYRKQDETLYLSKNHLATRKEPVWVIFYMWPKRILRISGALVWLRLQDGSWKGIGVSVRLYMTMLRL